MRRDDGTFLWGGLTAVVLIWIVISSGTRLCVSTPGTSGPSVLSLSDLSNLKMDNSTINADFLDRAYWGSVYGAYTTSVVQIIPNTVIGFFNKSAEMRSWAFENIPSPPPWLSSGIVGFMEAQLAFLRVKALAAGNSTLAALIVKSYAASVVGYPVAALDYVSMNGVTAIKTYLQTGNIILAVCATYPSQLGALYAEAFDPSVPREMRAQYLGNALAVTTLMVVLAGKDGFAPKFQDALNHVGLADAWSTIKPYLSRIGSSVSVRASSAVFAVLETVAKRFPQDSTWATGLTADRIESMVEVLHDKGLTNDAIEQKVQGLAQAAHNAPDENAVADAADVISYNDGGLLRVKVDREQRLLLYSDEKGTAKNIPAKFLHEVIPGFKPDEAALLKVHYIEKGVTLYHYFTGQYDNWVPKVPNEIAKPGDIVSITVEILTRDGFVKDLPTLILSNDGALSWAPKTVEIRGFILNGDDLQISVTQQPALEGVSSYIIDGTAQESLGFNGGISYLDFQVIDVFGQPRDMRVIYNGYDPVRFGVLSGPDYSPVFFIASDGVKLRLISNTGGLQTEVATIYMREPSILYSLGDLTEDPTFVAGGVSKAFVVDHVTMNRGLELSMRDLGSNYDRGRLGAEIAYTVGTEKLGLKDVVLVEPSKGGEDLYTKDGKVVIQARILTNRDDLSPTNLDKTVGVQLSDLVGDLKKDFDRTPTARTGYAILSYLDPASNVIKTIVLEVLRA